MTAMNNSFGNKKSKKRNSGVKDCNHVSSLRQQMINDLELAGRSLKTQENYIVAVAALQKHFNIRQDKISERQVYKYILCSCVMKKRAAEMLPCEYFHVIATVPRELRPLFLKHQKILYGILMKTTASALCELA